MATSNWQNISYCCDIIYRVNPRSVLDIGLGSSARWGVLIREFGEIWYGNIYPKDWKIKLHGIEIFKKNILKIHHELYNKIYNRDATIQISELGNYDLIILGDVIEHLEKEKAIKLLVECCKKSSFVMVNTPIGTLDEWEQGELYGNPSETHKYIFSADEFLLSKNWKIVKYKLFKDYINRKHGTFLITSRY